jgi:hypothetical protein
MNGRINPTDAILHTGLDSARSWSPVVWRSS